LALKAKKLFPVQIQTPRNLGSIGDSENFFIQFITWTLITVALNFPHSLWASENRTNNLDKVCAFISESINDASRTEGIGPHIISDKSGKTVAELNFKPSIIDWKLVSLSFWEGQDFPTTQVRAVPPCKIISARQFGRTADGDEIIISYGTDLKVRSTEPQNPPFMMAGQPMQAPSEPLLALVDTGVNYNLPMVQKHLALGQDGQLIGYDFWDNDNRPFDKDPRKNAFFPLHHGTTVFSALSQELGDLKAAIYRFPAHNMCRFNDLIDHAENAGVRIVNMSMGSYSQDDWTCFHDGAKQHPHILFVISAGNDGFDIDVNPVFPASFGLENIVVVTSSDLFGRLPPQSNYGRVSVDLMVPAEQVDVFDHRGVFTTASGSSFAAPRVAALAARFLKKNVEASTTDIIDFLKSRAINSGSTPVRFGWIPDPSDDFKL
jgi:hypothetical protein